MKTSSTAHENPILNNPYEEPELHYATNRKGELDYQDIRDGRRVFAPDINVIPARQDGQKELWEINEYAPQYETHLVNLLRQQVKAWRSEGYPHVTRVTKELLTYWFLNPERVGKQKLFFAQREAIETAIYLNEVAARSNAGTNVLNRLRKAQQAVGPEPHHQLPRIAFKMATGTGKTVVMATLIFYHFANRQEYRQDTRFADYFLVVAPGITIRDRLGVLRHDKATYRTQDPRDYYGQRYLVPRKLEPLLERLNARIVITNYHSFEPRTLQGNKRSPSDGKIVGYDEDGKAIKQVAKQSYGEMIKGLLGTFRPGSRLLILNDEAHHCYLPRAKGKTQDTETDENAKAAVWFTGLAEISQRFKLTAVYDLSATPYYLQGSGYESYSLFDWVVSDFGLIEAIEAGLVKIPYLPEGDNTQELDMPVLRNLYEHVKDDLPKKGQRKKKQEAKAAGNKLTEEPPRLPVLVKGALDQFYNHYHDYSNLMREAAEAKANLFSRPPVFIAVCNNTSVSKEVYKFIAGYETEDEAGETRVITGQYDLFSNYDQQGRLKRKAPTLIIDSEVLEDADQISDDFKKIFAAEIEEFRREYAREKGQGAAAAITDAQILREVVNTVGQPGKLGGHIRCVVSVSMLTEGWDANTVTHIMGLRAFGSQLLCEQVAGRALRRMNYDLQAYDRRTGEPIDPKNLKRYKEENIVRKFPPEYAHIIGVPFKMFKGGTTSPVEPPDYTRVKALPERLAYELTFPVLDGYRIDYTEEDLQADFSQVENFQFDGTRFPTETRMASAFSGQEDKLEVRSVLERREQEIIYLLTKELIRYHFSDDDQNPRFQLFSQLKEICTYWYQHKLQLLNIIDPDYKKLIFFENPKIVVDHINKGINPHLNAEAYIKPIFNYHNPTGSSRYVAGNTTQPVYPTRKSHVNYVVEDSGWEGICAKTLDELPEVLAYVKNAFLDFKIPYVKDGKDRDYLPDFIARVQLPDGQQVNLIIEVTGMNKDKAEKKWYVENRWLPAVNAVREKRGYDRWAFLEVDETQIKDIKNAILAKIQHLSTVVAEKWLS